MPPPLRHQNPSSHTPTTTTTATQTLTSTPVLRLRATAASPHNRRRIQWAEDVVDNEGLGRKRSKVCCIYHAPHPIGESSSESSSSSDSSSDSDSNGNDDEDDGRARKLGGKGKGKGKGMVKNRRHEHDDELGDHACGHDHCGEGGGEKGRRVKRKKGGNAYETAPKVNVAEVKS